MADAPSVPPSPDFEGSDKVRNLAPFSIPPKFEDGDGCTVLQVCIFELTEGVFDVTVQSQAGVHTGDGNEPLAGFQINVDTLDEAEVVVFLWLQSVMSVHGDITSPSSGHTYVLTVSNI